jgi:hypothetical protein
MKFIFVMFLTVFSFLATANCPSKISISNIKITKFPNSNANPVFQTHFLMATFLEETNGMELMKISTNNNPNECGYLFQNASVGNIKSTSLVVDSENNKFDMKVDLLEPTLDGFGTYIESVQIKGSYAVNENTLEIDINNNNCFTLYNGDQWWGTSWVIFKGADSGTFTIHE